MKYLSSKDSWRKSGIYKIKSNLSEKIYIGQTMNFRNRYNQHKNLLKRYKNPSVLLQKISNKYGFDSLIFEVVEFCDKNSLNEREFFYLNNIDCKLNISKSPEKIRYGIKHTYESKIKMVETRRKNNSYKMTEQNRQKHIGNKYNIGRKHSISTKIKIGEKSKGRKWSDLSKEKLSKSLTGRKMSDGFKIEASKRMMGNKNALGAACSDERKNKIKEAVSKKVIMISLDGKEVGIFDSAKEAAKKLGSEKYRNISSVCRNKRKTALGYKWKYYE